MDLSYYLSDWLELIGFTLLIIPVCAVVVFLGSCVIAFLFAILEEVADAGIDGLLKFFALLFLFFSVINGGFGTAIILLLIIGIVPYLFC